MVTCQPTMQLAAAKRRYELLHEKRPYHDGTRRIWAEKASKLTPFHYSDGVSFFLAQRDLGLGGDFLGQGLVAQQPIGDVGQGE